MDASAVTALRVSGPTMTPAPRSAAAIQALLMLPGSPLVRAISRETVDAFSAIAASQPFCTAMAGALKSGAFSGSSSEISALPAGSVDASGGAVAPDADGAALVAASAAAHNAGLASIMAAMQDDSRECEGR